MTVATKVSIRADAQGVLSMQFMIEVEGQGGDGQRNAGANGAPGSSRASFVDFRIVPLLDEGSGDGDGDEDEDEKSESEDSAMG